MWLTIYEPRVAAWRDCRVSLRQYFHRAQLHRPTAWRWVGAVEAAESLATTAQSASPMKRSKRGVVLPTSRRNLAAQAFWAMHVEAMTWSGMKPRAPADALAHRTWTRQTDACQARCGASGRCNSRQRRESGPSLRTRQLFCRQPDRRVPAPFERPCCATTSAKPACFKGRRWSVAHVEPSLDCDCWRAGSRQCSQTPCPGALSG